MENRKQKEENEMEIDLVSLFFYLIDKWKLLFLGAVVGVVLAGALVFFQTPMYESNSTLYVLSKTTSITSITDLQVGTELTSDFSVIATSKPVIDGAIKTLKKENIKLTRKEIIRLVVYPQWYAGFLLYRICGMVRCKLPGAEWSGNILACHIRGKCVERSCFGSFSFCVIGKMLTSRL